jgi:DNA polymerase III epsilon subunit-like protein
MIICDLESTSLNVFEAEIVTGYFIHVDDNFNIISEREIKCCPFKWSHEAEKVHGISQREAYKFKKFSEVYEDLITWIDLSESNEFWCHSNVKLYGKIVPYDYAIMRMNMLNMGDTPYWQINKLKPFSTHSLAKVLQERFTFEGFSLDNVCNRLGIKLKHHDSRSDALACLEIMKQLLPLTNREALYNYERGINENDDGIGRRNRKKSRADSGAFNQLSH